MRNLQAGFQSSRTPLNSRGQRVKVLSIPHPHQHLELSGFSTWSVLAGVKWCLTVDFICISLMTTVDHCSPVYSMSCLVPVAKIFSSLGSDVDSALI